jgi:hypothetical protein
MKLNDDECQRGVRKRFRDRIDSDDASTTSATSATSATSKRRRLNERLNDEYKYNPNPEQEEFLRMLRATYQENKELRNVVRIQASRIDELELERAQYTQAQPWMAQPWVQGWG